MLDLETIRREYLLNGLRRGQIHACPFEQFKQWMKEAMASELPDPTAMTLATVSRDGQPSQRIVLLKHIDLQGLVFFTNYDSAKAKDIEANPRVSLHFPWHLMERQVRVDGRAEKVSAEETAKYFASRPRESQLAAWASPQSSPIASRRVLLEKFEEISQKFGEDDISAPEFWGGYRVEPSAFEFWQGGGNRLHDRFQYLRSNSDWQIQRLGP